MVSSLIDSILFYKRMKSYISSVHITGKIHTYCLIKKWLFQSLLYVLFSDYCLQLYSITVMLRFLHQLQLKTRHCFMENRTINLLNNPGILLKSQMLGNFITKLWLWDQSTSRQPPSMDSC